jgi:hypothetical protein
VNEPRSLLGDIRAVASVNGPRCTVAIIAERLEGADAADFAAAIADPTITASAIWRALAMRGHHLGADTIRRHRNGVCACGRFA